MRLSKKKKSELYQAIHDTIVDARIKLKLGPDDDFELAQVEHRLWKKQKEVLGIPAEE